MIRDLRRIVKLFKMINKISFSFFIINLIAYCNGQSVLNQSCQVARTGAPGICQFMRNCRSALVDFEKRGILPSGCGYENGQQIVCCASQTTTIVPRIDVPVTRISQESKK